MKLSWKKIYRAKLFFFSLLAMLIFCYDAMLLSSFSFPEIIGAQLGFRGAVFLRVSDEFCVVISFLVE